MLSYAGAAHLYKTKKHYPKAGPLQVVDRLSTAATRASPWKKHQSYDPSSA